MGRKIAQSLILLWGLLVLSRCQDVEEKQSFTIINEAEPTSLDPHRVHWIHEIRIVNELFEGLFSQSNDGSIQPALAERWQRNTKRDHYLFYLRGAVWSDGIPITAQTLYDSWLRALTAGKQVPYAYLIERVIKGASAFKEGKISQEELGIKVMGKHILAVSLSSPVPQLFSILSNPVFAAVPIHKIEALGEDWIKPENFVGNGPFLLEEWIPQKRISLIPNRLYWDRKQVYLDQALFIPYSESLGSLLKLYEKKEVDWIVSGVLLKQAFRKLGKNDGYRKSTGFGTYFYILNTTTATAALHNPAVRRALSMAIDRGVLVSKVLDGGFLLASSLTPPMKGYYPKGENFDPKRAQHLLAQAGYPDGEKFPPVKLLINAITESQRVAFFVQKTWKEVLGIETIVETAEKPHLYVSMLTEGAFQISEVRWLGDYADPTAFLDLFSVRGSLLEKSWSSPLYNALLEEATKLDMGPRRAKKLRQAEEFLIKGAAVIIPLYHLVYHNLVNTSEWKGWEDNLMDQHPLKGIRKRISLW